MKLVIPGGSGHVGAVLVRHFHARGDEVVILSRRDGGWDGKTIGAWVAEIDGADVVINLAGRSVNCRYDAAHLKEMMDSRVDSTRVIGQAIAAATDPPKLWLQSSTATIYSHRFDAPNDEATGILGGDEPGAPPKWIASIKIAKAWEAALGEADTPGTRKVAMRSAMTMSIDRGSVFWTLAKLTKLGLGGRLGTGKQFVSWIHEHDFAAAVQFLVDREDIDGAVNISSPNPLPQAEFARNLRQALHVPVGLPALGWMVEIGCALMKTESELVLKSRRVVPGRLLAAGFQFRYPSWPEAAQELAGRVTF